MGKGNWTMSKVVGMQELVDRLEKMQSIGTKIGNKALNNGGNIVRKAEIEQAKKHDKWSKGIGVNEIKKYRPKTSKSGKRVVDIGLKGSMSSNKKSNSDSRSTQFDKIRGLYFNNYGFYHNITGEYIAGSNWIGKAYEESADEAYEAIKNEILKELNLWWSKMNLIYTPWYWKH